MFALKILFTLALYAQQLEIHHLNVGQADATLIKSPTGVTMLIDGGNNGDGTGIVIPYLSALGITSLNYVVCSHYHADHLSGLDEVINGLGVSNIGAVYDRGSNGTLPTTQVYIDYVSAANATGRRYAVTLGQTIALGGGATIECVAVDKKVINYGAVSGHTDSENDYSIGWVLTYNSFRYFTGGDLGGESSSYYDSETPLAPQVGDIDAMKVDHHGSQYSTNQTFVDNLKPQVAVIEVGNGNSYGHPVQSTLNRLVAANCYIYQTELGNGGTFPAGKGTIANGNIVIKTSGTNFTVTYGGTTDTYPLPVELTSFRQSTSSNNIALTWNTATEANNYGFEVDRKVGDSQPWSKIGFVAGFGTSNSPHSYSYVDAKLNAGRYSYRLKQIDNDGNFKYSERIVTEIMPHMFSLQQNYPDPFNPSTRIGYSLPAQSRVVLNVYNLLGQQIAQLANEEANAGTYEKVWNANVASGLYFYRLEAVSVTDPSKRFVETKKMLLLR